MTGYDFDKTIYDGNSFVDFYFYCLLRRPYIVLLLPYQGIVGLLYVLHIIDRRMCKQLFHHYLFFVFGTPKMIANFWQSHLKKIKPWYLEQQHEDDLIVSASPKSFLRPACDLLGIKHLIATDMNLRTGVIHGANCYKDTKVIMFNQTFGKDAKLQSFYSDSKSDIPMMLRAEKGYFVYGHTIEEYQR